MEKEENAQLTPNSFSSQVLSFPVHQLDGKIIEPKIAVPRKTNPKMVMRTKKIFVGGLSATTSLEDVKAYFEQFRYRKRRGGGVI